MMKTQLPDKMKAIQLEEYNKNIIRVIKSLKVSEIPVPDPGPDAVLVKIEAAPCNPSDIAFMLGRYIIKKELPKVLGFEGTGRVVAAGIDPEAQALLDKKVSCFTQDESHGTWAEYFLVKKENCIVVPEDFDTEQAACFSINPFTAYGMMDSIKDHSCIAIILTAAAGQVGQFIRVFARQRSIEVINVVRKEKHADMLRQSGARYTLNLLDEDFESRLKAMAHELNATVAFDAAGGDVLGKIFNAMPVNAEIVLYGGLTGMPVNQIDSLELIFNNKVLKGFNLNHWFAGLTKEKKHEVTRELISMVSQGILKTKIQSKFSFDSIFYGLRQYMAGMSEGKILFRP